MVRIDGDRTNELQSWLAETLEKTVDFEPEAMAEYVSTMLKNKKGEEADLRGQFAGQLTEFMDTDAVPFIDQLFVELHRRGMILDEEGGQPVAGPSNPTPNPPLVAPSLPTPPDEGIPIPLDMFAGPSSSSTTSTGQKRGRDSDDVDMDRGPPKGPRLGNGVQGIQRYESRNGSGSGYNRFGEQGGNWRGQGPRGRGRGGRGGRGGPGGPGGRQGPGRDGREPCRDFHERGYCARGMMCPYTHGDDMGMMPPMMPFFMPGMMPGMPSMPMPVPGPNGEMTFPMMPNMFGPGQAPGHGGEGQDGEYDPSQAMMPLSPGGMMGMMGGMMSQSSEDQDMDGADGAGRGRGRGGFRGGRGRGRGRDGHGGGGFRPSPDDKTLLVEKIPNTHLSMQAINEQFKKHGTITNIAVDARGAKAMVSFATHEEAQRAHRDPEPVFGSRFVKVLWHRPLEGRGTVGQEMLEKSKVLVNNMNKPLPPPTLGQPPSAAQPTSTNGSLAARSQLLEKHLAEQKNLMQRFEQAGTPAERKEIMRLIRENDQQMKQLKEAPVPTATPSSTPAVGSTTAAPSAAAGGSREQQLKDRLDKELELQTTMDEVREGGEGANPELLAQLAQLREEARKAGVPLDAQGRPIDNPPAPAYTPGYSRPYVRGRGRGRGRGGWRGGPPVYHQNLKLDLRPKTLVVKGVSGGDAAVGAVREFYVASGGLQSLEAQPDGSIHVSFFSRPAAESAMAKGSSIPSAGGNVSVTWQSQGALPSSSQPGTSQPGSDSQPGGTQDSREVEQHLAGDEGDGTDGLGQGDDDPWATSQDIVVDE